MIDDIEKRRKLSFLQAECFEDLPRQLKRGEMPRKFRLELWRAVDTRIFEEARPDPFQDLPPWHDLSVDVWVEYMGNLHDEHGPGFLSETLKETLVSGSWEKVFDLLTFLVRYETCPSELHADIDKLLVKHCMAYRLNTDKEPTFIPVSTPEEGEAAQDAMHVVAESGIDGAHTHLRGAADAMNRGRFADSVRESISAAESVARVISGKEKGKFSVALGELKKNKAFPHKALHDAFSALYGYTSDEKGIRHSLLEKGDANVGEEEAQFMFGACASFCSYLCRKQHKAR